MGDFTDETLEGELADQKLGGLLVSSNLSESDSSGLIAMRLLDTAGGWGGFAGGLGGELLTGGFASGGFTCDGYVSDDVSFSRDVRRVETRQDGDVRCKGNDDSEVGSWRFCDHWNNTYELFAWCEPLLMSCMIGMY